jgi:amidase
MERYIEAQALADECRRRLDALVAGIDVVLTPAAFGEAPVGAAGSFVGGPLYQLWTILHVPCLTIPVLKGPAGMPIGAQLIAKRHDDRKLFACAQWAYEKLA